ncbi:MAG TPA: spore coat protein [Firmicutes bacterium]|nr:spore coat protein [Bacillota bacterium]
MDTPCKSDRLIMENLLLTTKGACGLYLNGTIESATANVYNAFHGALKDSLAMQDDIYKKMAAKGWYPAEQAEQEKLQQVKQKFAGQ